MKTLLLDSATIYASLTLLAVVSVIAQVPQSSPPTPFSVPANPSPHAAPEQPLPFSHQWHAGNLGLACTYCHTNPDPGRQMTIPATSLCMGCHQAIATDHPAIKKLAEYSKSKKPIPWVPVYQILTPTEWSHHPHLHAGLDCKVCHGPVNTLPGMKQLTAVAAMASCIACHHTSGVSTQCNTCHAWPSGGEKEFTRMTWKLPTDKN
jgi:hypothetical protein